MANQYLTLPVPVGNGAGAAVDVSTCGALKTFVVGLDTAGADALTTIEVSLDASAIGWSAIGTVQGSGSFSVQNACRWMRVRVQNWKQGSTSVNVGSDQAGGDFADLPATAGSGAGAAVDISALLGLVKTIQITGTYRGGVAVEFSEDGISYAESMTFNAPGMQTSYAVARYARTRRINVPSIDPGTPLVTLGAVPPPGGEIGPASVMAVFNTPGTFTWTAPADVTQVLASGRPSSGGGGGGTGGARGFQAATGGGGAGGGGGTTMDTWLTVVPGLTYTIVIPLGGAGGTGGAGAISGGAAAQNGTTGTPGAASTISQGATPICSWGRVLSGVFVGGGGGTGGGTIISVNGTATAAGTFISSGGSGTAYGLTTGTQSASGGSSGNGGGIAGSSPGLSNTRGVALTASAQVVYFGSSAAPLTANQSLGTGGAGVGTLGGGGASGNGSGSAAADELPRFGLPVATGGVGGNSVNGSAADATAGAAGLTGNPGTDGTGGRGGGGGSGGGGTGASPAVGTGGGGGPGGRGSPGLIVLQYTSYL